MILPNRAIAVLLWVTGGVTAITALRAAYRGAPELAATAALVTVVAVFASYEFYQGGVGEQS